MKKYLLPFMAVLTLVLSGVANAEDRQTKEVFENPGGSKMKYLLHLPKGYEGSDESFPLLLFLHGGGEGGMNLEKVKKHGPAKKIAEGHEYPFIVVSPQNPYEEGFWDDQQVYALLQQVIKKHRVDTDRLYLSGLSRGGYGAWRLAMNYPETFAAAVIVCPASSPEIYASRIKHLPLWVFHGGQDKVVPIAETERIIKRLKSIGGNVKYTVYPDAGHDSWTKTFDNPEVTDWLLKQSQ